MQRGVLMQTDWQNKLYFGDNLEILRDHVGDESVDLIYLDPVLIYSARGADEKHVLQSAGVAHYCSGST